MGRRQLALRHTLDSMTLTKMANLKYLALTSDGCQRLGSALRPVVLQGKCLETA